MRLYLVQHGEAVSKEENPDRPLSEKGRQDVNRLAAFLARSIRGVSRFIHSGKPRAWQTAQILADTLTPGKMTEEAENGLGPNDPTDLIFNAAEQWAGAGAKDGADEVTGGGDGSGEEHGDVMLIGHMPFMDRLASRLIAGTEEVGVAAFEPGSVLCVERTGNGVGGWQVAWMVRPEQLGG